jgi:hypothetical protein
MDTTINEVLLWWGDRPAGEAMTMYLAAAGVLVCLYQAFVRTVRHNERKRVVAAAQQAVLQEVIRRERNNTDHR